MGGSSSFRIAGGNMSKENRLDSISLRIKGDNLLICFETEDGSKQAEIDRENAAIMGHIIDQYLATTVPPAYCVVNEKIPGYA